MCWKFTLSWFPFFVVVFFFRILKCSHGCLDLSKLLDICHFSKFCSCVCMKRKTLCNCLCSSSCDSASCVRNIEEFGAKHYCVCVKRITLCNCLCSSSSCGPASVIQNVGKFGAKNYFTDQQTANTIHGFRDSVPVFKIHGW